MRNRGLISVGLTILAVFTLSILLSCAETRNDPISQQVLDQNQPGTADRDLAGLSPLHSIHKDKANCGNCHANGYATSPTYSACLVCHSLTQDIHNKHSSCIKCHTGGTGTPPPPTVCFTCHKAGTPSFSDNIHLKHKDQVNCSVCHPNGYDTLPVYTCGSCHNEPDAIHNKHSDKLNCVDCHKGAAGAEVNFAVCTKCHGISDPLHVKHVDDNNTACGTCHTNGAALPPNGTTCAQCHNMPGMHVTHQISCFNCHKMHGGLLPSNPTCLICHTDKADHFPTMLCRSCHKS